MVENQGYIFFIEERWINIDKINFSKEFFDKIRTSDNKIIEIKDEKIFKFTYVGVISFKNEIIIVMPKYYDYKYGDELITIKKIIKVFKKIPKKIIKQHEKELLISSNNDRYSEIAICDYLLKDYINNGLYIKKTIKNKLNNNSNLLDWKRTVNELTPIFSNGSPIYNECYYKHYNNNHDNLITQIHMAVIEYSIAKYSELLDYKLGKVQLKSASKKISSLGSNNKLIAQIEIELQNSFNDRDINLFKALLNFFEKFNDSGDSNIVLYGTTNFELVWEYLCGYLFGNEYEHLCSDIDKILWRSIDGKCVSNDSNLLKPDILRVFEEKLLILDAKYYLIDLEKDYVKNNPGTYDIVKQLTYGQAFKDKGYTRIVNCLLYPKEQNVLNNIFGSVNLEFFNQDPIVNIYISPSILYDRYLINNKLNKCELYEIVCDLLKYIEQDIKERNKSKNS